MQKSFRFVGVRPPEISPPSTRKVVYLDEGFQPYRALLDGRTTQEQAEAGREEHWSEVIQKNLVTDGKNLIRTGLNHIRPNGFVAKLRGSDTGKLPSLLKKNGVEISIIEQVADVNLVFGK
jgi:hypothetical protein